MNCANWPIIWVNERSLISGYLSTKVLLSLFGALTATKSVADQWFGGNNSGSTVVNAALGVMTATIAGITASFRFEERSTDETQSATEAWTAVREMDSSWRRQVMLAESDAAFEAALVVMKLQDDKLADLQIRAAKPSSRVVRS
jgi:hypothetical protein